MKYLICSDIHGAFEACKKIISQFESFNCDKLIILGDTLYHGPRNPLPEGHNPKAVAELLNKYADKIIACRGNCDAEVDQMVLQFQTMADYVQIIEDNVTLFCTHGHVYAPILSSGTIPAGCETASKKIIIKNPAICFYGHTHVSVLEKSEDYIVCNPGSPSLPKMETAPGFAIYQNKKITLYTLAGEEIKNIHL